jgi:hypothetical protein
MSVWQSTLSRTVVALVEMMSSEFICLFWLIYESYACGGLLNLLIHFMLIVAYGLMANCLLSCDGLFMWIHSYFACLGIMVCIIA